MLVLELELMTRWDFCQDLFPLQSLNEQAVRIHLTESFECKKK